MELNELPIEVSEAPALVRKCPDDAKPGEWKLTKEWLKVRLLLVEQHADVNPEGMVQMPAYKLQDIMACAMLHMIEQELLLESLPAPDEIYADNMNPGGSPDPSEQ